MQIISDGPGRAELIRSRQSEVLQAWQTSVLHEVIELARLDATAIIDPIETLLARLADCIAADTDAPAKLCAAAEAHAIQRFQHGFTIDAVVREYAQLRRCLRHELDDRAIGGLLDEALDAAIAAAMRSYTAQREEVRERVVGVLAHDLRSPLACVTMASEMLITDDRSPRERSLLEMVLDASDRMHRMINDVLSWARTTAGVTVPVAVSSQDFAEIMLEVIDEIRVVHGRDAITCRTSGDLRAALDRDRVHQLLTNLVRNAIEHGMGSADIELSEVEEGRTILLVVRNRGPLRSPNSSDVADPFRRRARTSNGRGLGLFIVDQIARAHGAALDIALSGEDTAITIRWPTRRAASAAEATP